MRNIKKLLISALIIISTNIYANEFNTVKVTADILNMRKSDSTESEIVGKIKKGSLLYTIGENRKWFKVKAGNKEAWISKDYVDILEESVPVKVTARALNVRKKPDIDGQLITKLPEGTKVKIIEKSGDWYKIVHKNGSGYVFGKYVSLLNSKKKSTKLPRKNIYSVVDFAKTKLGSEYVWGANGPDKFDCSGYVKFVFENTIGVELPRTSFLQSKVDSKLDYEDLEIGDLVFFDTAKQGRVNHVGIYIGDGKFIHASSARSKKKVTISNLSKFYKTTFKWGVRI